MIGIFYTEEFAYRYRLLPLAIQKKAERHEKLFRENPFYPSLHTEKLHPRSRDVWSFRNDKNYRLLFRFKDSKTAYFLIIGPHHWIYRYMDHD